MAVVSTIRGGFPTNGTNNDDPSVAVGVDCLGLACKTPGVLIISCWGCALPGSKNQSFALVHCQPPNSKKAPVRRINIDAIPNITKTERRFADVAEISGGSVVTENSSSTGQCR